MEIGKLPPALEEITPVFINRIRIIEKGRVKQKNTEILVRNPPYLLYREPDESMNYSILYRVKLRKPGRPHERPGLVGRPANRRKIGIHEVTFQNYIWRLNHNSGFTCPICLEDIEPGDTYFPKRRDALTCSKSSCRKALYRRSRERASQE